MSHTVIVYHLFGLMSRGKFRLCAKVRSADVRMRILLRHMKSVQNTHLTPLLHCDKIRFFSLTCMTKMWNQQYGASARENDKGTMSLMGSAVWASTRINPASLGTGGSCPLRLYRRSRRSNCSTRGSSRARWYDSGS